MSAKKEHGDIWMERYLACSPEEQTYMVQKYTLEAIESMGRERFTKDELFDKTLAILAKTLNGVGKDPNPA